MWIPSLFAVLIAAAITSTVAAGPQRIVSINLCADQLLLMLAKPDRIASVTYLATNPEVSPVAGLAKSIPQNYGSAEEVLNFRPDLVLASVFSTHSTNAILKRFGIPLLGIPVAKNIQDIRESIRMVAAAIGSPGAGENLLEEFDKTLAAASLSPAPPNAVAALYRENNVLYGSNTIAGSFTRAAGMENLADKLGLGGFSDLPLEILIEHEPDIIVQGSASPRAGSGILAYRNLYHPALHKLIEKRRLVRIPDRLWACGSPAIVRAIEQLAAVHRHWRDQRKLKSAVNDPR
ncbi:MAG: ABC transporter substrate-binding protein [Methylococcaceae bacterium]|nr:ABC transporter substrate-binding protein [Methylococcaceae bacterium]